METEKAEGRLSRCTTASKAADGRGLQEPTGQEEGLLGIFPYEKCLPAKNGGFLRKFWRKQDGSAMPDMTPLRILTA